MSSDIVIRAENLGKRYLIGHQGQHERYTALRDVVGRNLRNLARSARDMIRGRQLVVGDEVEEFWALKDINFEIKRGEVVGIIGRNGAGKSTLLKILSRITEPSEGRVEIRGRVASLLEVGTGFHPELTGRENIYLNGAILGMTRAEIKRKFDEIVDFAGVEKFLDTPVKRYSSGMYVRLAFAVAAHLEPEILVVDEVLAVGDAEFQKKCLGKMGEVAKGGRTVLFVSHNMGAVRNLTMKAMVLESARIIFWGATDAAIQSYLSTQHHGASPASKGRHLTDDLRITKVLIDSKYNHKRDAITIAVALHFICTENIVCEIEAKIFSNDGIRIATFCPGHFKTAHTTYPPGEHRIKESIELVGLAKGTYYLSLYLTDPGNRGLWECPHAYLISAPGKQPTTAVGELSHANEHGPFILHPTKRISS